MGFGSRELAERAAKNPLFFGVLATVSQGRLVPVPGGVLIKDANGAVLGAVGISGDTSDKDEVCAIGGIEGCCRSVTPTMTRGVIPVLYSYYGQSGALDLDAHMRQIDWVMPRGATGVTLLGLASEGASLTQGERKSVIAATARRLPADAALLVTTRVDDDLQQIARIALEHRREVGLIVQIGADPAPSIAQIRKLSADPSLASSVGIGLQLAPGLIDTEFSAASLQSLPDIVQRLSFLKAEYNSIELDAHLKVLGKTFDLLVGRNGQN